MHRLGCFRCTSESSSQTQSLSISYTRRFTVVSPFLSSFAVVGRRRPPRARPSLARLSARAGALSARKHPTRSQTSRASRSRCRRHHRATRRRIVIAIEDPINERTKERDSRRRVPHRARATRKRREGNEGAFVASRAHLMMNERAVARWRRRRVTRPAGVGNRDRKGSGWLGES